MQACGTLGISNENNSNISFNNINCRISWAIDKRSDKELPLRSILRDKR